MNKYTLAQVHDGIAWLDGRYRWHGEEEDKQCADMLRAYAAHLRERESAKAAVTEELAIEAGKAIAARFSEGFFDQRMVVECGRAALEAVMGEICR